LARYAEFLYTQNRYSELIVAQEYELALRQQTFAPYSQQESD
jgi:hypothetical protein